MVSCPDSACASEGAQCCMGVAGPKQSKAGVGSASPRSLAKPGSVQSREPTRVGSCPESACAAEGAPGRKGVTGPKPSVAGGACSLSPLAGEALVGAHLGGSCPDSAFTAEGLRPCSLVRLWTSRLNLGRISPEWAHGPTQLRLTRLRQRRLQIGRTPLEWAPGPTQAKPELGLDRMGRGCTLS